MQNNQVQKNLSVPNSHHNVKGLLTGNLSVASVHILALLIDVEQILPDY